MILLNEEPLCIYYIHKGMCEREKYEKPKGEDGNFCIDNCTVKFSYLQSFYLTVPINVFNSRILTPQSPALSLLQHIP